jgi:hypothetical protein
MSDPPLWTMIPCELREAIARYAIATRRHANAKGMKSWTERRDECVKRERELYLAIITELTKRDYRQHS